MTQKKGGPLASAAARAAKTRHGIPCSFNLKKRRPGFVSLGVFGGLALNWIPSLRVKVKYAVISMSAVRSVAGTWDVTRWDPRRVRSQLGSLEVAVLWYVFARRCPSRPCLRRGWGVGDVLILCARVPTVVECETYRALDGFEVWCHWPVPCPRGWSGSR